MESNLAVSVLDRSDKKDERVVMNKFVVRYIADCKARSDRKARPFDQSFWFRLWNVLFVDVVVVSAEK